MLIHTMAAFAGPMVRIRLPPAESPRTIGSAGDFTGSMSGVAGPARVYRRERWAAYKSRIVGVPDAEYIAAPGRQHAIRLAVGFLLVREELSAELADHRIKAGS